MKGLIFPQVTLINIYTSAFSCVSLWVCVCACSRAHVYCMCVSVCVAVFMCTAHQRSASGTLSRGLASFSCCSLMV